MVLLSFLQSLLTRDVFTVILRLGAFCAPTPSAEHEPALFERIFCPYVELQAK